MNLESGLRLTSSTSSVSPPPRSTITVAAGRGTVSLAEVELLSGPGAVDRHSDDPSAAGGVQQP